jgi:triosephosphate isomerase (TIM)
LIISRLCFGIDDIGCCVSEKIINKNNTMARQKIVAGNWKMNKTIAEGEVLANELKNVEIPKGVKVVMCTPFTSLASTFKIIKKKRNLHLGAQNMHEADKGAYTGEISADMLLASGVEYVILGHSERRQFFAESDELLAKKVNTALAKGLTPIFCCGEPLEIREAGTHVKFVENQLKNSLFHLSEEEYSKVVIAYEPIWAIGTGKTASSDQAQEMHAALRKFLGKNYGKRLAGKTPILYGGSCNAKNAKEIFAQPDVDGGLIGGASLVAADFEAIIKSF